MVNDQAKTLLVLMFGKDAPSTRFRWLDFQLMFKSAGWKVIFHTLEEVRDLSYLAEFDVVVLQKTMVSRGVLKMIRRHAKKLVYDVDDRIWMRAGRPYRGLTRWKIGRRMCMICEQADVCIAANSRIADDLATYGADPVIVPMALDLERWSYQEPSGGAPVIGWTGGPKNLHFLEAILPALREVLDQHECRLKIHSGRDPEFPDIDYEYVPYLSGKEYEVVREFDIGLCPLPDDPFSCGKSPIKTLQYLASGAATLASPNGAVQDILADGQTGLWAENNEQWKSQLSRLVEDAILRKSLARQGRACLEQHFSVSVIFDRLVSVL